MVPEGAGDRHLGLLRLLETDDRQGCVGAVGGAAVQPFAQFDDALVLVPAGTEVYAGARGKIMRGWVP